MRTCLEDYSETLGGMVGIWVFRKSASSPDSMHVQQGLRFIVTICTFLGRNHAAIAYAHGVVQPDGTWEGDEPLLVLFAFKDGKIVRIEELW